MSVASQQQEQVVNWKIFLVENLTALVKKQGGNPEKECTEAFTKLEESGLNIIVLNFAPSFRVDFI